MGQAKTTKEKKGSDMILIHRISAKIMAKSSESEVFKQAITKGKCLCVLDLLDSSQNMDYEMFGPAIASNQRGNMEQEIFSNCHLVGDAYLENTETFYPNEHGQGGNRHFSKENTQNAQFQKLPRKCKAELAVTIPMLTHWTAAVRRSKVGAAGGLAGWLRGRSTVLLQRT